jgi:hypothetical protein
MILQYRRGYKGQVSNTVRVRCPVIPKDAIVTQFIELDLTGLLTIRSGYAYDFASGPTIDWPEWIRAASLLHDALCQLHRQAHITDAQRKQADQWFKAILRKNGMLWPRWAIWYKGVRLGSKGDHRPKREYKVTLKLPELEI